MGLPVNYVNAVLNSSMGGLKQYTLTQLENGKYTIVDATTYDQEASTLGAAAFNTQNEQINGITSHKKIVLAANSWVADATYGYKQTFTGTIYNTNPSVDLCPTGTAYKNTDNEKLAYSKITSVIVPDVLGAGTIIVTVDSIPDYDVTIILEGVE